MKKYKEKVLYIIAIFLFTFPSFIYFFKENNFIDFSENVENHFLLNQANIVLQGILYLFVIFIWILAYYLFIYRKKFFKNIKVIFIFIFIVSIILVNLTPFLASDIFYYLGIGRLNFNYKQNPYYTTLLQYFLERSLKFGDFYKIQEDTVILAGIKNCWSNTTVVYGPIWTIICGILSTFSMGNLILGLFTFKIASIIVHILNCYMIFKISKKNIFVLMYGLNPFVLIEGIGNMHNDIYMMLFVLVAIYFLTKKKNIILSLLFLSFSVNIKFVMVLLLPYFVIYHLREMNLKQRILGCIKYGIIFLIMFVIPYLLYMKDFSIFTCFFVQRERYARGVYRFLKLFLSNNILNIIKNSCLIIFCIIYIIRCFKLLFNKKISFRKEMQECFYFIFVFIFTLLTNFQAWYLIWISTFMIWQKSKNIKFIIQIQNWMLISYSGILFLQANVYGDIVFFLITVVGLVTFFFINAFCTRSKN